MKINIKSLLTGTTLFVASASNINAVPPNGIKLIDGEMIDHPVFGEMKVISHKEDLDFYKEKVREEEEEGARESWRILRENFIQYVLGGDAFKQCEYFSWEGIERFVRDVISKSAAGMAMLEVITANYMREYDRIKQFCENHQAELKACYDFSQTKEGRSFYEKERQIFELEEKLKEWLKSDYLGWEFKSDFSKLEISSDELKNLYEYFRKEEEVFNNELKESWTQLRKENFEDFFIKEEKDYESFCELCKHFLNGGNGDLVIHNISHIKPNSKKYQKLQNFVFVHKAGFEKFFNIGHLRIAENSVTRGSITEWRCRRYYSKHAKDLERLSQFRQEEAELLKTAKSVAKIEELIASRDKLEKLYKQETKKANEEKFSCIRRSFIPACCFPILYRHFFVKNDPKYAKIENVNKFLFHTLKFKDGDEGCSFDRDACSITGQWDDDEVIENYYIDNESELLKSECKNWQTPLQHELMHFMNALYDFDISKESEKIKEQLTGIIKIKVDLEQQKIIRELYDNGAEMWTMYGIFICEDNRIPGKYILYYDPINEAVANAQNTYTYDGSIQVVRTGHDRFKKEDDDESSSKIDVLKELDKEIGIYNFYFDKGEKLRELIYK